MSHRNPWKIAFIGSCVISLAAIALLAFAVLDEAITIDYMTVEARHRADERALMFALLQHSHANMTKSQLLEHFRANYPNAIIKTEDANVLIDSVVFEFDAAGRLVRVGSL